MRSATSFSGRRIQANTFRSTGPVHNTWHRFVGVAEIVATASNLLRCTRLLLCRFLDAGITSGATCSGGRRPKSARARSRGKFGGRAGGRRYGDLIVAPVTMVGAKLARGDRDRVRCAAWKRATGIAGVAWSPSTRGRLVDWRGRG